jgi:DNA recombination protein RmuC
MLFYIFALNRKIKSLNSTEKEKNELLFLQNQLNELTKVVDAKLSESNKVVQNEWNLNRKIISEITEKIVKLEETNKQVINFAEQLQSLEDILKNPKQRGVLGEYFLETLLKNVLPPEMYQMQYKFKDGTIVDAAIFIKEKNGSKKIIPVDSKFSLENYNRLVEIKDQTERSKLEKIFVNNLKERIIETSKYIKPEENTMDFAFMFIPHEAIYYDLLINKIGSITEDTENLIQRAANKYRVIIISPTSFLAYLQTILQGLRAFQIEESAKEIRKRVEELSKHLAAYENYLQKLGNNLETTVNMYNYAYKEFGKIDKDIFKITGESIESSPKQINKPEIE